MSRLNLYNVYDNGKLIMEKATRREIVEKIGCETVSLTRYATEGVKYRDRYTFSFYGENVEMESAQTIAFKEKWNAAVTPFKNVIWVKSGGKRLRVGGVHGQRTFNRKRSGRTRLHRLVVGAEREDEIREAGEKTYQKKALRNRMSASRCSSRRAGTDF